MDSIASLFVEIGAKTQGFTKGLSSVHDQLNQTAGKFSQFASMAATGFGMAIATPILGAVGGGFSALTDGIMGTNAALQQSQVAWGVLLGGADKAQAKIDELYKFAATTPFEFGEVDKASRILQTFGGDALNTSKNLTMIGDVAAGVGQPFGDVAMWTARMYDAFQSGKPFGEAAARLQEMGAMSGVTRTKLEEMQKAGATADEMWAVLSGSMGRFGGMMDKQSQTFTGRLSTMKDSLSQLLATAGRPIFDALSNGLGRFNDLLASPKVGEFVAWVGDKLAGGVSAAVGAFGALLPKVQGFGQIVGAVFDAFKTGDFSSAFGPILAAVDKIFGEGTSAKVAGFVNTLLSVFQVVRDAAMTFFQALSGDWGGQFDTRINDVVKAFGLLGLGIRDVAQWVTGTAIPALEQFRSFLGDALLAAIPLVQNGLTNLATGARAALDAFTMFIGLDPGAFASGLGGAFDQLGTVIQTLIGSGLTALSSAFTSVQGAAMAVWTALQPLFNAIQAGVSGAMPVLVGLWQQLTAQFAACSPTMAQVANVWQQLQALGSALAPLLQSIGTILGALLVANIGLLMGALGGLVGMFSGLLPGAIQAAAGVLQMVTGVVQVVEAVVTGMVQIVSNLIRGDWNGAWESAKTMLYNVTVGIASILDGLVTTITGLITGLVGGVKGLISGFVDTLLGYFTSLAGTSTTTVETMVNQIVRWFQDLSSRAGAAVQALSDNLASWLSTMADNAGAKAAEIGNNIVSGIAGAISAGAGQIRDAIAGAIGNVIDFAKGLLGIHSPSRVFGEMGENIMLGLGNGIRDLANRPRDTIRDALGGVVGAASDVFGGGLKAFGRGGGADVLVSSATGLISRITDATTMISTLGPQLAQLFQAGAAQTIDGIAVGLARFDQLAPLVDHPAKIVQALSDGMKGTLTIGDTLLEQARELHRQSQMYLDQMIAAAQKFAEGQAMGESLASKAASLPAQAGDSQAKSMASVPSGNSLTIQVNNPVSLGNDRETARQLASLVQPELDRLGRTATGL